MALSNLEIQWTSLVFTTLVTDSPQRIKRGAALRKRMLEEIEAGKAPVGYRPDWIRGSAKKLIVELGKINNEFNDNHPTDQASTEDLMDILATAMEMLRTRKARVADTSSEPVA